MKIHLLRYPVRTLSIMLILIILMIFLNSGAIFGQSYNTNTTYTTVTVEKGDTLWSIADRFSNGSNINSVMLSIIKYNRLPNHNIEAGQILYVPLNSR